MNTNLQKIKIIFSMAMMLVVTIILIQAFLCTSDSIISENINAIIKTLDNVLDFIIIDSKDFQFDGLLGVTIANAQLQKCQNIPGINNTIRKELEKLIVKCYIIHSEVFPRLKMKPPYLIDFRDHLLNPENWLKIGKPFINGHLDDLGIYKTWSPDDILSHRVAEYKGHTTDVCFEEILSFSQPEEECYISPLCEEIIFDNRIDVGYLLTHRLLYLQIKRIKGCYFRNDNIKIGYFSKLFCSQILKEAKTNENLGFVYHDIFLEQVTLCGLEGYTEFFKKTWLDNIIKWSEPFGCYTNIPSNLANISKRTSTKMEFGCTDHATGLGAVALAMNLKYLLYQT